MQLQRTKWIDFVLGCRWRVGLGEYRTWMCVEEISWKGLDEVSGELGKEMFDWVGKYMQLF